MKNGTMPEETKENKAKKLAAARKKLKEYQQRGVASGSNTASSYTYADSSTNSGHVSSNISERSESEPQLNGSNNDMSCTETASEGELTVAMVKEEHPQLENVNYFALDQSLELDDNSKAADKIHQDTEDKIQEGMHNINAIQVLIAEKSQLTTELNKFRTLCREKDLEMEELRVQHSNATQRVDDLSQRLIDLQKQQEQQRLHNAELQHKLAQARAVQEDHSSHVIELKQQLTIREERLKQLETDFKDKCNALELSHLRIRQISDENNITKDSRVETLTQTQFMYEQQIRDLQAMVQQLTQDKEQANMQYQTYVQQLNAQVQQLTERNIEMGDETAKLQEREKQWVDHIQQLEKEIQKNISRQNEVKEGKEKESTETLNEEVRALQERIIEFETERYEFILKIKSQEDRLSSVTCEVEEKDAELQHLKDHWKNISAEQPDKIKLLAAMESDKVAASRALTQNVELKKQLDELELRFVQLTNDKAELVNHLDSEKFANREVHANFSAMEERLRTINERFKFKDEEMIRLSHENEVLKNRLENANMDNNAQPHDHAHEECDYHHKYNEHDHHHHDNNHDHHDHHDHCHDDNRDDDHHENGDQQNYKHDEHHHHLEVESCEPVVEEIANSSTKLETSFATCKSSTSRITTPLIATEEAVERLQQRFTKLMTQCADLTEEKLRLEHLVTQLQSETETIGEYIALYQTQRRILKQREYEKAAQTAMLQAEREQIRDRLTMLNHLVHSLGLELPQNAEFKQQMNKVLAQNVAVDETSQRPKDVEHVPPKLQGSPNLSESVRTFTPANDLNSPESQQILHKIQDIITEIKENTKELPTITHSVDQLNCCSGKFEVV